MYWLHIMIPCVALMTNKDLYDPMKQQQMLREELGEHKEPEQLMHKDHHNHDNQSDRVLHNQVLPGWVSFTI